MGVSLHPDQQDDILSAIDPAVPAYGPIQPSPAYLEEMITMIHPPATLQNAGYVLNQLSPEDLDRKKRCFKCNRIWNRKPRDNNTQQKPIYTLTKGPHNKGPEPSPRQTIRCKFHSGKMVYGRWTCCNGNHFTPPCAGREEHTPRIYAQGELAKHWRFYSAPRPAGKSAGTRAVAVVLDCEMGTNIYGESELIRISVIDYFSKLVLLDTLVWPDVAMLHYNTKFSGVSRKAIVAARNQRTCLFGRAKVRERLWEFIGPDTIVVGHGANGDLSSLRWIHHKVIDTFIVETKNRPPPPEKKEGEEAEEAASEAASAAGEAKEEEGDGEKQQDGGGGRRKKGGLSLKALASERLNRSIQNGKGHDSLEDAIATRDILHWNISRADLAGDI